MTQQHDTTKCNFQKTIHHEYKVIKHKQEKTSEIKLNKNETIHLNSLSTSLNITFASLVNVLL